MKLTKTGKDWRNGFLFLGCLLPLDFLNTQFEAHGQPVEALPDCTSLAQWLAAAGLIPKPHERRLKEQWCLPIILEQLGSFGLCVRIFGRPFVTSKQENLLPQTFLPFSIGCFRNIP